MLADVIIYYHKNALNQVFEHLYLKAFPSFPASIVHTEHEAMMEQNATT